VCFYFVKREEQENFLHPHIHITTANVGDSRIVLGKRQRIQPKVLKRDSQSLEKEDEHAVEKDGLSWERLTTDHRLDDPFELARIQNAGGFMFKGRVCGVLAVTRSLGDQVLKPFIIGHPAVQTRSLPGTTRMKAFSAREDFLIVACDGLWDVMTDSEAVQLVDQYCHDWNDEEKKARVANYLVNEALRKGTADNVTVVVIWL
jgi:serine/threonine protein phosphatase PrpC